MSAINLKAPSPRTPPMPQVFSVEQLLPKARLIVRRKHHNMLAGLDLKPGEKVLMLTDSTLDPLVVEAFVTAIREAKGQVDVIQLEGFPQMTNPIDLVDSMFSRNWWPQWAWNAVMEADILMQGAFLKIPHTPGAPLTRTMRKPRVVDMEWTRDLLVSPHEDYPIEVRNAIDKKTWELIKGASRIKVTDLEGTELSWSISPEQWPEIEAKEMKVGGLPYNPGHLEAPFPPTEVEGVMVASSLTFGGPIERIKLFIEGRQVTKIEGGGEVKDRLLNSFERYKDLRYPANPAPGANWLCHFAFCTHPKGHSSPTYANMAGSGRMHAWAFGHRRSGVIHTAIGEAIAAPNYKVIRYFCLYFPTIIADGRIACDKGRFAMLDDLEIRKIAGKYGDPDELLREDWIPAIPGVNAP